MKTYCFCKARGWHLALWGATSMSLTHYVFLEERVFVVVVLSLILPHLQEIPTLLLGFWWPWAYLLLRPHLITSLLPLPAGLCSAVDSLLSVIFLTAPTPLASSLSSGLVLLRLQLRLRLGTNSWSTECISLLLWLSPWPKGLCTWQVSLHQCRNTVNSWLLFPGFQINSSHPLLPIRFHFLHQEEEAGQCPLPVVSGLCCSALCCCLPSGPLQCLALQGHLCRYLSECSSNGSPVLPLPSVG